VEWWDSNPTHSEDITRILPFFILLSRSHKVEVKQACMLKGVKKGGA